MRRVWWLSLICQAPSRSASAGGEKFGWLDEPHERRRRAGACIEDIDAGDLVVDQGVRTDNAHHNRVFSYLNGAEMISNGR
jgi:hypothetical protein